MRRTGSKVIGIALCRGAEGFLIFHHLGEASERRSWKDKREDRRVGCARRSKRLLNGELPDWFLILQMEALHPLASATAVVIFANGLENCFTGEWSASDLLTHGPTSR